MYWAAAGHRRNWERAVSDLLFVVITVVIFLLLGLAAAGAGRL